MTKERMHDESDPIEEFKRKLGNALKEARRSKGYTQDDVADLLNINPKTLSSYETGRSRPTIDLLIDFSKLYGVDPSVFFSASPGTFEPAKNPIKIPVLSAKEQYNNRSEFYMANDPIRFEYADVNRPQDYVYLSAPDDSMSDYRILENDIVLIKKGQQPVDGDVVAALVENYPVIRVYEVVTNDSYLLKPGDLSGNQALLVKNGMANARKLNSLALKGLWLSIKTGYVLISFNSTFTFRQFGKNRSI